MIRAAEKYISGVLSGEIVVSQTTLLTFQRHERDLLNAPESGWYFDKKSAQRVFDFCSLLNHYKDDRWLPFSPEPWQAALLYILFGWKKKNGMRRFNYAYIEIPKKNGKTTFASVIANYFLFFDNEQRAQIYCAATAEKQAHLCFDMATQMISQSPSLIKRARILTNNVMIESTFSKMEPIGRDSKTIEGVNPHCAIFDEYHVFTDENNLVFKNIKSATVNRRQPMIVIITTAGFEKDLPCYEYRKLCLDILNNIKKQDNIFSVIYTIDDDDDWKNPKSWIKANPNWGVSVIPERLQEEFISATNSRSDEVTFKTKNLNIWCDAPKVWITDEKWQACSHGITDEELKGQECYAGLDLAAEIDLNALALFFPDIKGMAAIRVFFWIPEEKIKEKKDKVDYELWVKQGFIKSVPGSIMDIEQQSEDILQILKTYKVIGMGYDSWHAHHGTMQNIQKGGFPYERLDPYSQKLKDMSGPSKRFESLIIEGKLEHFNNPVMRWMLRNTMIIYDDKLNYAPSKKHSSEKIDGVIAAITAIGEFITLTTGAEDTKIYKDHSLRFL